MNNPAIRVIHLIDSFEVVNIGVWKSVMATAKQLQEKGIASEIWYPEIRNADLPNYITGVSLNKLSIGKLKELVVERKLNKNTDIIISHGCWRHPVKWGNYLRQKGYTWIYTPHGMLEPWPMKNKYLKKKIYFLLKEKKMAAKADVIRGVSKAEKERLNHLFPGNKIVCIPNGVSSTAEFTNQKPDKTLNFVFMARLHHKKGITPLVKAWLQSALANNPQCLLRIAGPDEGELQNIQPLITKASNIEYLGMVSGDAKDKLLTSANYYLLPSYSEGFPTSLLEAMEKGAIPVITRECNFNEVLDNQLGYEITTDISNIKTMLETLASNGSNGLERRYENSYNFIKANYTLEHIASLQYGLYTSLLFGKNELQKTG